MAERVTMEDIANVSGVSISTISLVLNDRPGINPETRKRVLTTAKNLGYRKKHALVNESRPSRNLTNLGLIIRSRVNDAAHGNQFYTHVLAGIEESCRKKQINLLFATMPVDEDNHPSELPRLLYDSNIDGILLVGAYLDEALGEVLSERSMPTVLVDAYGQKDVYDAVISDNFNGAYAAVTYLINKGHRHIGLVGSLPDAYPSISERRRGYLLALEDNNIKETYFGDSHWRKEEALNPALKMLQSSPKITAVFGCNDDSAIATMQAATILGRRIPQDLSIIGFDDIAMAEHLIPSLTTMQVDKLAMGRLAVQLLGNRVDEPKGGIITAVIRPKLIERQSVIAQP